MRNGVTTTKRVGGLLGRDGLDIVERQGNLLNGLPVVGSLLGGGGGATPKGKTNSASPVGGLLCGVWLE